MSKFNFLMRPPLILITALFTALLTGCATTTSSNQQIAQTTKAFFEVYAKRRDFDQLMTFYADDAVLEDIVYGNDIKSKKAIGKFLNWSDSKYIMSGVGLSLVVQKQLVQGNKAVVEGYFSQFTYNDDTLGPWRFIIWLEFDDNGKINREVDWINYTPRKKFLGGKNMNNKLSPLN